MFKIEAVTVHSGYVTETICGSHLLKGKKICIICFPDHTGYNYNTQREQVIDLNSLHFNAVFLQNSCAKWKKKKLNTSSLTSKDKITKKEIRHFDHLGKQPFLLPRLLHVNKPLHRSSYACSTWRFKSTFFPVGNISSAYRKLCQLNWLTL